MKQHDEVHEQDEALTALKAERDALKRKNETLRNAWLTEQTDRQAAIASRDKAEAQLQAQDEAGWQPISTAPKDGRKVLIHDASWCGFGPNTSVSYWQPHRDGGGEWVGVTEAVLWAEIPTLHAGATTPEKGVTESAQRLSSSSVTACPNCGKVHDGGPRGPEVTRR